MGGFDILLAAARGGHLIALLSWFGALVSAVAVTPAAARPSLHSLIRVSSILAVGSGIAGLLLATAGIAGTSTLGATLTALPDIVTGTRFGELIVLRLVVVLAAMPLPPYLALPLGGVAVALQGLLGHAGALGGPTGAALIGSEALHMLAAGAWLGGLLPLLLCLRQLPPAEAAVACERFSPIGIAAVTVLAGTALAQACAFIQTVPGLVGTSYGRAALVKLGLFLLLLLLAARNRLTLTDRLTAADAPRAQLQLRWSVGWEIALGIAVVVTAAFLASTPPAIHEQPVWPFPFRLSTQPLDDPQLRREVAAAGLACVAAVTLVLVSLWQRRWRLPAAALAGGLVAWSLPSFSLLLAPAYPTTFVTLPTDFAARSIAHGAVVFAANCAACHGSGGKGDGPAGKDLPIHPADLTQEHLRDHPDGNLLWWISHGVEAPDGSFAMPGFASVLAEPDLWATIDYIHALNAGTAMREHGAWPHPFQAPDIPLQCADTAADTLMDLRGKVVRLVAGPDNAGQDNAGQDNAGQDNAEATGPDPKIDPGETATVVRLVPPGTRPSIAASAGCTAMSQDAWTAYAILAGDRSGALAGTEFLIDPNGFARAIWRPLGGKKWHGADALDAMAHDIRVHPLSPTTGDGHEHHH
jgi:putative copper export protein/mono/diheme cytochrome c family protein